ncbi:MAG: hypothetical protein LUO93_07050 [Methanomicrobiales archaeon]|nr:hypothetical protein [Methanomicrobiales archaeon]
MDPDTRSRAKDALRTIFETAAYQVDDLEAPLDLSATQGDTCVVLLASDDTPEVEEFDNRNFRLKINDKDITCTKLLFTTRDDLKTHRCVRWGLGDLAAWSGEAAVARVMRKFFSIPLAVEVPQPTTAPGQELVGPEILHFPVKITAKRAVQIAGIEGVPRCRYLPHWQYQVSVSGERSYKGKSIQFSGEKKGMLNAINGIEVEAPEVVPETSGIIPDSEMVQMKIDKEQAKQRIINEIVESQTKTIRLRQEKGDAIYYEEKVFRPEGNEVKMDLNLIYVPVWSVKGKKIIEVNGYTGEVLTMPMDEGCEIL